MIKWLIEVIYGRIGKDEEVVKRGQGIGSNHIGGGVVGGKNPTVINNDTSNNHSRLASRSKIKSK